MWRKVRAAYVDGLEAKAADGSPDHRARVMNADSLLSQMYGKPAQKVEQEGDRVVVLYRPPRLAPGVESDTAGEGAAAELGAPNLRVVHGEGEAEAG